MPLLKGIAPLLPALLPSALCAARAQAVTNPPVTSAPYTDTQAYAQAQAAVSAATPPSCGAPLGDTLYGTAGFGTCMPAPDATRPTAVQAANTTLNSDCTWSVTFNRTFTSSTPIVHAEPVVPTGATQPLSCSPTSRSTTTQTGRCFQAQTTTLAAVTVVGVSVAVGAQTVNPTTTTCTPGIPIMVWGREPTQ